MLCNLCYRSFSAVSSIANVVSIVCVCVWCVPCHKAECTCLSVGVSLCRVCVCVMAATQMKVINRK